MSRTLKIDPQFSIDESRKIVDTRNRFLMNDCYSMRWFVLSFAFLLVCFICANCSHSDTKVTENTDDYICEIDVLANLSNTQK